MSHVTSLVLVTSLSDYHGANKLNKWLEQKHAIWGLAHELTYLPFANDGEPPPLKLTGGSKNPQLCLFAAGLNFFGDNHEAEFVAYFRTLEWERPREIVLILQHEEGGTIVHHP